MEQKELSPIRSNNMDLKGKCGILLHPTSFPSPHGISDLGDGAYNFIDFLNKAKQSL